MKLEECTPELERLLGCTFQAARTGSPDWIRVFIMDSRGVTIGRLSFHFKKLEFIKFYKDKLYGADVELCESDRIADKFYHWLGTGKALSDAEYNRIIRMAEAFREEDLRKKMAWRKEHPGKRRKLTGYAVRQLVRSFVMGREWTVWRPH